MVNRAILYLSACALLIFTATSAYADPLLVSKTGDQAPGFDNGTFFTNLSPPVITKDGKRIAFLAQLTGDQKVWYFGDKQGDGYFDLKVAAKSGMAVNGSNKLLDLIWSVDGSFIKENPRNASEILLDPVTGKLAFIAHLNEQQNLGNEGTGERALFVADDSGVTLIMKEGPSEKYSFVFESDTIAFQIAFAEVKFHNDRLLIKSVGSEFIWGSFHHLLLLWEDGDDIPLVKVTSLNPENSDATISVSVNVGNNQTETKDAYIERVNQIALNENGTVVANVSARVAGSGIRNVKDIEVIRYRAPSSNTMENQIVDLEYIIEQPEEIRVFTGFPELTLNNDDVLQVLANFRPLSGLGSPNYGVEAGKLLITDVVGFPGARTILMLDGVDAPGYQGEGSATINDASGLQMAGAYTTFYVFYPGSVSSFFGNYGLLRYNHETQELSDMLVYVGGPSHVSGLGNATGIQHVILSPDGHIFTQISADEGFERALLKISPPGEGGSVTNTVLATTRSSLAIDCEFGCSNFTPFLPVLGFPPYLNVGAARAIGPHTGVGMWTTGFEEGWLHSDFDNNLYIVIEEFEEREEVDVFLDFGDAPETGVGFSYPTALTSNGARHTSLINSPLLGSEVDYELDGAPTLDADGDDSAGTVGDDEDGIELPYSFPPGKTAQLTATATQDGKLDAWIDFNRDGDWKDSGEQIIDSADVVDGENPFDIPVPMDAELGESYARFRISGSGNLDPTGLAQGGEVEDYKILIGPAVIPWSSLRQEDGKLHLEWDGPAILQGTDDPDGPWTTLVDDANSYSHTINGAPQFFRLVHPAP
ncbi:MAG: GEVED domain-containing protein [Puniceicoccaceae bacterium]